MPFRNLALGGQQYVSREMRYDKFLTWSWYVYAWFVPCDELAGSTLFLDAGKI